MNGLEVLLYVLRLVAFAAQATYVYGLGVSALSGGEQAGCFAWFPAFFAFW